MSGLEGAVAHQPALLALRAFLGDDQLMFGTDHPFSVSDPQINLDNIAQVVENRFHQNLILSGVARKLFNME